MIPDTDLRSTTECLMATVGNMAGRFLTATDITDLQAAQTHRLSEMLLASGTVDDVTASKVDVVIESACGLVSERTMLADVVARVGPIGGCNE